MQPQEVEVFYLIPGIKKNLAVCMRKSGLKQNEIANLLQIEDATVSHYLNNKRGNKFYFEKEVLKEIYKSSKLIKDELSFLREVQRLLRVVKRTREICRIHKILSSVPEECTPELIGCFGDEKDGKYAGICYR